MTDDMAQANINSEIIIKVKGLSKGYKVYNRTRDVLLEKLTGKDHHQMRWVLNDVNFEIKKGEIIGLIGSNGAGKSTLLKIISGKLDYTSGKVDVYGKLTAILELGTGFHSEYTGRENIIMGAICMGMSREEAIEKSEWIINFSELAEFIDHPFKTYSSGMKARLTFSTAVSVEPNILIVDEALAAGDAAFVSKALERIQYLCGRTGTTALLTSHSMSMIHQLCNRAIYIKNGTICSDGTVHEVAKVYETEIMSKNFQLMQNMRTFEKEAKLIKQSDIELISCSVFSENDEDNVLYVGHPGEVNVKLKSNRAFSNCQIGIEIYTSNNGMFVTTLTNTRCKHEDLIEVYEEKISLTEGDNEINFSLPIVYIGGGSYFYHVFVFSEEQLKSGMLSYTDAPLNERYAGNFIVKRRDKFLNEYDLIVEQPVELK